MMGSCAQRIIRSMPTQCGSRTRPRLQALVTPCHVTMSLPRTLPSSFSM